MEASKLKVRATKVKLKEKNKKLTANLSNLRSKRNKLKTLIPP